ncbi:hypothetical protein P389DRAFT_196634 [Cystobasidium minutum MCA 4210]|uniref:uncharacterized protein n=1 Tax=Cystobasidium minutum MCA 4210 TaxID=1397322 RepID=UPI0034CE2CBC|eukprot:jgi/Rhomi1/196634/gm1.4848_g
MDYAIEESVDVTMVLKDIIQSYPYGPGLLRELLQNSDDAGSTYQTFILDKRSFGTATLYDSALAKHQGPALIAVNDSIFRPGDWKAITQLYESSTTADQTKAGKFGIGFRASYHLTDSPAILSDQSFVVLNPHATLAPQHRKGFSLPQTEWLAYADQLAPFEALGRSTAAPYAGTAIRLPLRTPHQAPQSKIKKEAVTEADIATLFMQYLALELEVALLYLRHVRKISFKIIQEDGSVELLGEAEIAAGASIAQMRNVTGLDTPGARKFALTIKSKLGNTSKSKKWYMLHYVEDTRQATNMVEQVFRHTINNRLRDEKLYPHVALAMPEEPLGPQDGKLFTVLPLPVQTGFPLHVHAMLAITPDRQNLRNNVEHNMSNSRDSLLVCWNRTILNQILPQAWRELLLWLRLPGNRFYDSLPPHLPAGSTEVWSGLFANLCSNLQEDAIWPDNMDALTKMSSSIVCSTSFRLRTKVAPLLRKLSLHLIALPLSVYEVLFGSSGRGVTALRGRLYSPQVLASGLRGCVGKIQALTKDEKVYLLDLVTSSGQSLNNSIGLPLWPVLDGSIVTLHAKSSTRETIFLVTEKPITNVFTAWRGKIVDTAPLSSPLTAAISDGFSKKGLTCNLARLTAAYLPEYLASHSPGGRSATANGTQAQTEWCHQMWSWPATVPNLDKVLARRELYPYPIVPNSTGLLSTIENRFIPSTGMSEQLRALLVKLGVSILPVNLDLAQLKVWKLVVPNEERLSIILPKIRLSNLSHEEKVTLRNFILNDIRHLNKATTSNSAVIILKTLPIWPVLQHGTSRPPISALQSISGDVKWVAADVWHIPVLPGHAQLVQYGSDIASKALCGFVHGNAGFPLIKEDCLILALQHWELQQEKPTLLAEVINGMHAVFQRNSAARDLFCKIRFIAVTGSSEPASLERIVQPDSSIESLFFDFEHVLPTAEEIRNPRWRQFCAFDLVPQALNLAMVQERLATFYTLKTQGIDEQKLRVKLIKLLELVDQRYQDRQANFELDEGTTSTLRNALQATAVKPANCVEQACRDRHEELLFDLVLPVIPYRVQATQLRQQLGWESRPSFDVLLAQIVQAAGRALADPVRHARVVTVLKCLAGCELSHQQITRLASSLAGKTWVPTVNCQLVLAKNAILKPANLQPAFSAIHRDLANDQLVKSLGLEDEPGKARLLDALRDYQTRPLTIEELKCTGRLLDAISLYPREEYYGELLVPSKTGSMIPVASALIPDPLIQESDIPEGTFLLNDKITLSLAQKLRIRSAREAVFADKFFENGGCEDWTQKQAPSHQIAKLLKQQYSLEQMMYEVIANAEDAGAHRVVLVLDERDYSDKGALVSPEMADQMGPALLIYNDAVFSERDWQGFNAMGEGSKGHGSAQTIGRFGLGALSMFHLADTITVLSGSHLAFFDPLCLRLPQIKGQTVKPGGLRCDLPKIPAAGIAGHLAAFEGLFNFNSKAPFEGTIFRLPLRQKPSELSSDTRSGYEIRNLLSGFADKAKACFLFTERLQSLSATSRLVSIQQNLIWSASCQRDPSSTILTQSTGRDIAFKDFSIRTERSSRDQQTEHWVSYKLQIPADSIASGFDKSHLALRSSLSIGIAFETSLSPVKRESAATSPRNSAVSNLFATLPLPIQSTLPFALHGDFILSQDRSTVRLHSDDCPAQADYNKILLQDFLPP